MTLLLSKAHFLTSAAAIEHLPVDTGAEIAFAGRSNAGKSTAINRLTGQKQLARASKTPGRTQLINFFSLDETHRLVDLPGYGFAKVPMAIKLRWQETMTRYLESRQSLVALVLLMDIRHPLKPEDVELLSWAQQSQLETVILLTKADKLSRQQQIKTVNDVSRDPIAAHATVVAFSATQDLGVEKVQKTILHLLQRRATPD